MKNTGIILSSLSVKKKSLFNKNNQYVPVDSDSIFSSHSDKDTEPNQVL